MSRRIGATNENNGQSGIIVVILYLAQGDLVRVVKLAYSLDSREVVKGVRGG